MGIHNWACTKDWSLADMVAKARGVITLPREGIRIKKRKSKMEGVDF